MISFMLIMAIIYINAKLIAVISAIYFIVVMLCKNVYMVFYICYF